MFFIFFKCFLVFFKPFIHFFPYFYLFIFPREISGFETLLNKRTELFPLASDFSLETLFLEIDSKSTGFIDFKSIFDFFKKNAIFPYDEEIISILHRFDSDGDGRLSSADMRNFLLVTAPTERPVGTDVLHLDNSLIDKMHEATDNLLKSIGGDSAGGRGTSNVLDTPSKKSLNRYDYYPYESVRKSNNSPMKFNTPTKGLESSTVERVNDGSRVKNLYGNGGFENKDGGLMRSEVIQEGGNGNHQERAEFVGKMKEQADPKQKINYRNTVKPSFSPFESGAKKNKSLSNPSDIEKISEAGVQSLIHDAEQRSRFLKEIEEDSVKAQSLIHVPEDVNNSKFIVLILNYLIRLSKASVKLSEIKHSLLQQPDFNLIDFFGFFDKGKKGYCTIDEFIKEITVQNSEISVDILEILVKRFDRKNTQKLRFVDFEKLMTTVDIPETTGRRPLNIRGFDFKYHEVGF